MQWQNHLAHFGAALTLALNCHAASLNMEIRNLEGISANGNAFSAINDELTFLLESDQFGVTTHGNNQPIDVNARLEAQPILKLSFNLKLTSQKLSQRELQTQGVELASYIKLRFMGHSEPYALWVARAGIGKLSEVFFKRNAWLATAKDEIAVPWIQKMPEGSPFFDVAADNNIRFLIVDGDLAWVYTKMPVVGFYRYCLDGAEFSPLLKEIFHSLNREWREKLASGDVRDNTIDKSSFFRKNLLDRWKVEWRSPMELNPGTSFD